MTGFTPDLGLHYGAAGQLDCDGYLIGSRTLRTGLEMEGDAPADPGPVADRPPIGRERAPYWFVVDSRGSLHGMLHAVRPFPGLRDVVVLTAGNTSSPYRAYLDERDYRTIDTGRDRVDLADALAHIRQDFGVGRVLVDGGPTLTSVLLDAGLVDEVSVLVHPMVVGSRGRRLFGDADADASLRLLSSQDLEQGVVHLRYAVARPTS